jgi:hypothetical protein
VVERNLRRPLAYRRVDGRALANKIRAVGVWLENRVRDDTAALNTRAEVLDISVARFLRVTIIAAAVAAADEEERDDPQHSQDGTTTDDTTYDGDCLWARRLRR